MNFYSDMIMNEIIDNQPLDKITDLIQNFGEQCFNAIARYSYNSIHDKYIYNVLGNTKNIVAFHCLDTDFSVDNSPSILVYRKCKCNGEIRYYVLIACTKRKFRGQGYASKLIDGMVERIKEENQVVSDITIKVILSSVEECVIFYENYGFKWTRESITDHPMLMSFERYEEKKEYFIMELVL
jgi:ribosomal protein S18 acetylase RimI-like enzyme